MKKFVKVSLIIAGVMFLLGCLLGIISAIGGKHQLKVAIKEELGSREELDDIVEDFVDSVGKYVYEVTNGEWGFVRVNEADGLVVNGETVTKEAAPEAAENAGQTESASEVPQKEAQNGTWYQIPISTVRKLEIELGAGELIIDTKSADGDTIDIQFDGLGNCNYYMDEETLHIDGFKGLSIMGGNAGANEITVRIPENMYFEEIDMEIGAGVMSIGGCKVGELETKIGAGELTMEKLEVTELSAEIGAGELNVTETSVQNADLDISMGECIFKGTITGELEADCDMGNLELELTGKETDHNYQVSCAAGNIRIGNFEFAALAASREIDNNAKGTFDINCNMGNIVVTFEE